VTGVQTCALPIFYMTSDCNDYQVCNGFCMLMGVSIICTIHVTQITHPLHEQWKRHPIKLCNLTSLLFSVSENLAHYGISCWHEQWPATHDVLIFQVFEPLVDALYVTVNCNIIGTLGKLFNVIAKQATQMWCVAHSTKHLQCCYTLDLHTTLKCFKLRKTQ